MAPRTSQRSSPRIQVCDFCTEVYSLQHFCTARHRKCFDCGQYGHYRKSYLCPCQKKYTVNFLQNHSSQQKRTKSKQRRLKDIERLLAFRERKLVAVQMPFYNEEDAVIKDFFPKRVHVSVPNKLSTVQINQLKCDNESLKQEILILKQDVESEHKLRIVTTNEITKLKEKLSNSHKSNNAKDIQINVLKSSIQKLEKDVNDHDEACKCWIDEYNYIKEKYKHTKEQAKKLLHSVNQLQNFLANEIKEKDIIKQEFRTVSNCAYFECRERKPHHIKQFVCRGCGSMDYHHARNCLASGNTCARCNKRNHFTAVCDNTKDEPGDIMQILLTKVFATTDIPDDSSDSETETTPDQPQAAPTTNSKQLLWDDVTIPKHLPFVVTYCS